MKRKKCRRRVRAEVKRLRGRKPKPERPKLSPADIAVAWLAAKCAACGRCKDMT